MKWSKILSREGVDLPTVSEIDLVFFDTVWKFIGAKEELFFSHFKDRKLTHYAGVDFKELGRTLYKKYFNSPEQIEKYYQEGKEFTVAFEKSAKEWQETINRDNSNKNLLKAFQDFREQFKQVCEIYSIISWIAIEIWQSDFEEIISNLIKKNQLEGKQQQIYNTLYEPWKPTALLEMQERIRSGENVDNIVKDYQFLRSWVVVWHKSIDDSWVKGLTKTEIKENKEKINNIFEILQPNEEENNFLNLAKYIVFFKDWRDDVRRNFVYRWTFLFEEISKKFEIEYDDLGYLTLDEIENIPKENKIERETIKIRKEQGCIVTSEGQELKIKVIDGEVPEKHQKIIDEIEEDSNKELEIKGTIAQTGKVTGTVRIMRTHHDIKKVLPGDVLVANTTHPNYLPAMHNAVAFVTNEGGMLSHSAIVAREMKKPCIVGTGVATKVLKDGDLVEVDADKGVVKKVK